MQWVVPCPVVQVLCLCTVEPTKTSTTIVEFIRAKMGKEGRTRFYPLCSRHSMDLDLLGNNSNLRPNSGSSSNNLHNSIRTWFRPRPFLRHKWSVPQCTLQGTTMLEEVDTHLWPTNSRKDSLLAITTNLLYIHSNSLWRPFHPWALLCNNSSRPSNNSNGHLLLNFWICNVSSNNCPVLLRCHLCPRTRIEPETKRSHPSFRYLPTPTADNLRVRAAVAVSRATVIVAEAVVTRIVGPLVVATTADARQAVV